ncbi:N-acetylmuramoyl-L-alanine amidase [Breoghania sp. L-A4]|uniref:N-acetylmuramoyl-L-alanine amidase n=1 Tax=Breoghania sp. L-A4 TaxID=2304600 RepID=UPI000E36051C|nr:N-acetylmuramoyl-L-alanine amidase [Breoghania sp. L-A4]AXS41339.1 N-acetylmuramoyl-L-alanine amidase [Breoghania sp. L-A4]
MVASDCTVKAIVRPSSNHGERRAGAAVDMIVLHYTGMKTAEEAIARLCHPASEVSCHYVVDEGGIITQLVPEARRAWHAGASAWGGERDINSCSIGIEIVNPGHEHGYADYPPAQVEAVIALARDIAARHGIPDARVLGHSDVAPGRKMDPGEKFPWDRLAAAGVGRWVAPEPVTGGRYFQEGERGQPIEALQSMLAIYGYELPVTGVFDARTRDVVEAFQRHFRPARVDGVADASTIATLHRLLTSGPAEG